jgi:hypothetical protein
MNVLENGLKMCGTEGFKNSFRCLVPTTDHVTLATRNGCLPIIVDIKTQETNGSLLNHNTLVHMAVHICAPNVRNFCLQVTLTQECKVTQH